MKRNFAPPEGSKEREGWDSCLDLKPDDRKKVLAKVVKEMDEPGRREWVKGWMDAWDTFKDASWDEIKRRMPSEKSSIKEEMKSFVRDFLRSETLGKNLAEIKKGLAKNPEDWWTNLPGKMKRKVCDILGLSKGKDIADFSSFEDGEQNEISAYFEKHHGVVEGFEGYVEESKFSDSSEWKNIEKAVKNYNTARHQLDLSIAKLAVMKKDKDDNSTYVQDAIKKLRAQFQSGKEIDLGYEV